MRGNRSLVVSGFWFRITRIVILANNRYCGGIFTDFICSKGFERYFSTEVEDHFIVGFCGGCACFLNRMYRGISLIRNTPLH